MRLVALSIIITLLVPLSGCLTPGEPSSASRSTEPEVLPQPEPGLSARARLRKAIGLLEVGEEVPAKAELLEYLKEEPRGKLANKLLLQIDADPQDFFQKAYGSESFLYTMRTGDSLSTVAQRFLGDAMLFHVLARYNGIQNPRAMNAGQVIRIPGKPPADRQQEAKPPKPAVVPPKEEAPEDDGQPAEGPAPVEPPVLAPPTEIESEVDAIQSIIIEAQELAAEGEFKGAAILLERGLEQFPDSDLIKGFAVANYQSFAEQLAAEGELERSNVALERALELDPASMEVKQHLATNYLNLADQHIDAGRYGEALATVNQAQKFDPQNAGIKPRMAKLQRWKKADEMYTKGKELSDAGEYILAYEAFVAALKIDPGHVGAEKERALLLPKVVQYNYGEGVKAFRRQDLDKALGFFDKALELNPNHAPAQLKRGQTLDLKKKLEAIPTE